MHGRLKIEFLSDTCFSMPASLDISVDTEAALDDLFLPMASGKTLHGLLRDTWLASHPQLDPDGALGIALFGEPRSNDQTGLLRLGDAHLGDNTSAWVEYALKRQDPLPAGAVPVAFLTERMLTAQDRETGAPQTETLRKIRVIPKGTILEASLTAVQPLSAEQQELLETLLALTQHVGLHRNRGLGHVRMSYHADPMPVPSSVAATPVSQKLTGEESTVFLHYRLTLTAPCLISDFERDPNSRSSKHYLSGGAMRGAIAALLVREEASDLEELITSGKVRYLNAYPEVANQRAYPTPITWARLKDPTKKDHEADPHDSLPLLFDPDEEQEPEAKQYQPLRSHFYTLDKRIPTKIALQRTTHQTRNREKGVTRKGDTTVFVYEAIKAEQTFRGCIALPANRPDLVKRMTALLQDRPLRLGRSARSSYGGAPKITVLGTPVDSELAGVNFLRNIKKDNLFRVYLASETILRDPLTGQHDPWQLEAALAKRFEGKAEVLAACVQASTATGYNRLWRTELPQVPCAAAGSVALLRARTDLSRETLLALQTEPLGERTVDGYGCLLILMEAPTPLILGIAPPSAHTGEPSQPPGEMLLTAQRRLYRERLRLLMSAAALEQAANVREPLPSASLFQRLRVPLRDPDGWRTTYATWFGNNTRTRLKEDARKSLEQTYLNGKKMWDVCREYAQQGWVPVLPREAEDRRRYLLVDNKTALTIWNEVKSELSLFYLDTLLSRLAKRASRGQ